MVQITMKTLYYICNPKDNQNRLDFVLKNAFPELGGRGIKRLCEQNKIVINNKPVKASYKVKENDKIKIILEKIKQQEIIPLCSTQGYTAIYKKPFIHTESQQGKNTNTIEEQIKISFPHALLLTRLDFATSGLIIFCENNADFENWKQEQKQNTIIKKYLALVEGNIQHSFTIKKEISTKNTTTMQITQGNNTRTTLVTPLAISPCQKFSFIECTIFQGARHQIRVHLANAGYPLVGDKKYGAKTLNFSILQHLQLCSDHSSYSPVLKKTNYLQLLETQNSEKFVLHHYQIQSKFINTYCLPPFWQDLPTKIQETILTKINSSH